MEPAYIKYVANYLRKSRGDSDNDLEKHRKVLRELCESNDWKYIEYCEIGSGDSIAAREVFQRLLYDIEQETFDAVCVIDIDRLGRGDMGDQDKIKKTFINSDTFVITPQQIYNLKNDDDEFVVDMKSFIARREYKQIIKRLNQGKRVGSKMGMWTNGKPPFPYEYEQYKDKRNPKGLVVNDEKLPTYRHIVESTINKKLPPAQIAWDLNRMNIPSPNGGMWHGVTVERILKSEVHLGKIVANKTKGDGHRKSVKKSPVVVLPRDKWVIVEGNHEAVKTQEEHNEILLFLSRLKYMQKRKPNEIKPLTGLIKCGLCNHTMTLAVREDRGLQESLKSCWFTNQFGEKCSNEGMSTKILYPIINQRIVERKEYLQKMIDAQDEQQYDSDLEAKKEVLLGEIRKKEFAVEKILDAFESGAYTLVQFKERKQRAEVILEQLKNDLNVTEIQLKKRSKENIISYVDKIDYFLQNIDTAFTGAERNEIYKSIIEKIVWTKAGENLSIDIYFRED